MKIQITNQKPDDVQRFFSAPLSVSQKFEVKKSLIVWQIVQRVKSLRHKIHTLAARK